jgi:carbon starvation protein
VAPRSAGALGHAGDAWAASFAASGGLQHVYSLFMTLPLAGVFGGQSTIRYPAFTGWQAANGQQLVPMLFITIACGACSGFHSLIASGTTSKQLRRETDARAIGYGTMLLEAMVAVVSLCCVMVLTRDNPLTKQSPNFIYALGMGQFLEILGVPATIGVSFALMAFTTFVYDTLDVCTRLGRYIVQELTGITGRAGGWDGADGSRSSDPRQFGRAGVVSEHERKGAQGVLVHGYR